MRPHPDSDHLSITETEVDNGTVLQIVCGAPNIEAGQKLSLQNRSHDARWNDDWLQELARVASYGMICSARELHLPNAEKKNLSIAEGCVVGEVFPK
ncbi:hypothetical protein FKB33_07030 [Enterococcus faecium]|nr:hypothetical protein [Enterococcus faecium]